MFFTQVYRRLLLLAAVMLAVLLSGCDQGEEPIKVDLSKRQETQTRQEMDSLTYAYLPQYSHRVSFARHHLLVEYLAAETGLPVRQVFPDSFAQHVEMVGKGEIDISFSNPMVYAEIADRFGARAIARVVEEGGSSNFRGQIISREDNKAISDIRDCRDKRWIAVSPLSAGGYLFALDYFQEHGLEKEDFRGIDFSPGSGGKQEKVVQAVYLGEYDIGSIREGTLELMQDQLDVSAIRVLAHTRSYPGWVYATRQGLKPKTVQSIKKALCALDMEQPEQEEILSRARIQDIIPARDQEFDPVRRLMLRLEGGQGE